MFSFYTGAMGRALLASDVEAGPKDPVAFLIFREQFSSATSTGLSADCWATDEPEGGHTWTVLGRDHRVVSPAEEYLEYLRAQRSLPITVKSYARGLALWWQYLHAFDLRWDAVKVADFGAFLTWLRTGDEPRVARLTSLPRGKILEVEGPTNPPARGLSVLRVRQVLAAVAITLTAVLSGCNGAVPTDGDTQSVTTAPSTGTTSESGPSFETSSPPVENTNSPEDPQTAKAADVAIELPGLPIGGSPEVVSETLQCAHLTWSPPPEIPLGARVRITSIAFAPAEDFVQSEETCPGGRPHCLDPAFSFGSEFAECDVPVAWNGPTLDDERLILASAGEVTCPAGQEAACEQFADAIVAHGGATVQLDPAPSEFETEDPTEDPTVQPTEDPTVQPTEDPGDLPTSAESAG